MCVQGSPRHAHRTEIPARRDGTMKKTTPSRRSTLQTASRLCRANGALANSLRTFTCSTGRHEKLKSHLLDSEFQKFQEISATLIQKYLETHKRDRQGQSKIRLRMHRQTGMSTEIIVCIPKNSSQQDTLARRRHLHSFSASTLTQSLSE